MNFTENLLKQIDDVFNANIQLKADKEKAVAYAAQSAQQLTTIQQQLTAANNANAAQSVALDSALSQLAVKAQPKQRIGMNCHLFVSNYRNIQKVVAALQN